MVRISLFTTRLLVIVSISHLYPYPLTRRPHGEKSFLTTRLLVIVFIVPDYPYPLTRRPCGEEISFDHKAPRMISISYLHPHPPDEEDSR